MQTWTIWNIIYADMKNMKYNQYRNKRFKMSLFLDMKNIKHYEYEHVLKNIIHV